MIKMRWKKITSEEQIGKILSTMTMETNHLENIETNAAEVSEESQDSLLFMREVRYSSLKIPLFSQYLCYIFPPEKLLFQCIIGMVIFLTSYHVILTRKSFFLCGFV